MNNELNEQIESDFYRHYAGSKPQRFWRIRNVALYCTIVYRKAHFYSKQKGIVNKLLGVYYRYKLNRVSRKYLFQIPYPVTIGKGFNFVHFGRVIIAPSVKIGDNCNIFIYRSYNRFHYSTRKEKQGGGRRLTVRFGLAPMLLL